MCNFRLFFFQLLSASLIFAFTSMMTLASAAEGIALPTAGDVEAPLIDHEPMGAPAAINTATEVRATVTDNVGVKQVTIFFRAVGMGEFTRMKMKKIATTDEYVADLGVVVSPGIEYYLQATDLAGNTLLRGAEFQPLTIAAAPTALDVEQAEADIGAGGVEQISTTSSSSQWKKYLYIGLGVVAVGYALNKDDDTNPPASKTATISVQAPVP